MTSSSSRIGLERTSPEFRHITGDEWEDASAPQKIQWTLEPQGDAGKWGWVVYRTSYKPELDVAWETLKQLILKQSREDVADSEAPEVIDKMEWIFVEDAATLEGASREELRRRFQTSFARAEMARFSLKEEDVHTCGVGSRYQYFLQADEEALLSLLHHPVPKGRVGGHVNIVKGWEFVVPPEFRRANDYACDEGDEACDPDWMKIMVGVVGPETYEELDSPENWYLYYMEPPDVCDH
ncbi:hypothetical protein PG996_000002 [Apiospora saccharicola]|uniref:Uncharacterized protein n=1 Tax=Apiospora saccharicola TaxID=335842 RepID=A0ABR1WCJ3_9PEZI